VEHQHRSRAAFNTTARTSDSCILGMEDTMIWIGDMITSNFRQTRPQAGTLNRLGDVRLCATLYHIKWCSLVLATLIVVWRIFFLFIAIFKSWGPELKSSALPLLFHLLVEAVKLLTSV
jgi:hypothetical protein